MYTQHGLKKAQGILSEINGKKALATFEGDKIVGYSTLEEIQALLEDKLSVLESLENIELKLEEINSYVKPSGCKSKSLFFVEFLAVAGALALILRKKH